MAIPYVSHRFTLVSRFFGESLGLVLFGLCVGFVFVFAFVLG